MAQRLSDLMQNMREAMADRAFAVQRMHAQAPYPLLFALCRLPAVLTPSFCLSCFHLRFEGIHASGR